MGFGACSPMRTGKASFAGSTWTFFCSGSRQSPSSTPLPRGPLHPSSVTGIGVDSLPCPRTGERRTENRECGRKARTAQVASSELIAHSQFLVRCLPVRLEFRSLERVNGAHKTENAEERRGPHRSRTLTPL